jgi:predicted nucleic acid-binding protein
MTPILVDTSLWYAMADDRDPNHPEAVLLLAAPGHPHITTNWIFGEAVTLLRGRLGHKPAVALGARLLHRPGLRIVRVQPEDEQAAWRIFQQYADKDFSFIDCTSFAVMRRLRIPHALTFDRHFQQMGFRVN